MIRRARKDVAAVVCFALLYVALFSPALLAGRLLPSDGFLQAIYYPRSLWTPHAFAGFPAAADPQNMQWYPVSLLLGALPGMWNTYVLSAFVLAASLTFGYVLKLTGSRLAALVAGIILGLSGFFTVHLVHTSMIHTAAWMPLVFWSFEELRTGASRRWVAVGAAAIGMLALAGHPQVFLYCVVLALCYAAVLGWRAPAGRWLYYRRVALAMGLGIAVAAILFLPAWELAGQSARSGLSYERFAASATFTPAELPGLAFPHFLPHAEELNRIERTGYVGLVSLLVAGVGIVAVRKRAVGRFWFITGLVGLVLAMGDSTPLGAILFKVPVYNWFRAPARHLLEFTFAVSVLAGMGVAAVTGMDIRERQRSLRFGAIALALLVLVMLGWILFVPPQLPSPTAESRESGVQSPESGVEGVPAHPRLSTLDARLLPWQSATTGRPLVLLAFGLLAVWWWSYKPEGWRSAVLVGAFLLDLGTVAWVTQRDVLEKEWHFFAPTPAQIRLPSYLEPFRANVERTGQRVAVQGRITALSNLMEFGLFRLWRLPRIGGYNPLVLRRYQELLDTGPEGQVKFDCFLGNNRVVDLLGTRYLATPRVIVPPAEPGSDESAASAPKDIMEVLDNDRWRRLGNFGAIAVLENGRAMPRAWLVPRVMQLEPDAIRTAIQTGQLPNGEPFDPTTLALVEEELEIEGQASGGTTASGGREPAEAKLLELADTHLEVRTTSPASAFLVLSDVYYPGWCATVDGEPARIVRTNYALRGLAVPAGEHVVRMRYRPLSFTLGAVITGLAVLVLAGLLLWPTSHTVGQNEARKL